MRPERRTLRLVYALSAAVILGVLWSAAVQGWVNSAYLSSSNAGEGWEITSPGAAEVDPTLSRLLADGVDTPLRVIVRLAPSPGVDGNANASAVRMHNVEAWVEMQRTELSRRRGTIAAILNQAETEGTLKEERSLWIVQSLAIHASPSLVRQLIAAPGISEVRLDALRSYVEPVSPTHDVAARGSVFSSWGVAQIQAPEVWRTLGVSGTGAVVAIMDTGVEYRHPALDAQYLGRLGYDHFAHMVAWHDPVNGGGYPYDDHGHGTHVAGSAVGAEAIGVAPGAQWMGVKVLNGSGAGYDSWIIEGFQWLLAPAGDPDLAPDIINASWSSQDSGSTLFEESVQILQEAGIFMVFASGNSGPFPGSVGSPASNRGAFAVGATDADDEVTYFSGRGPSPWDRIKPQVVAPGAAVVSAMPGGIYVAKSGTSMAVPHVAGVGALLRAVSPTLSVEDLARIITSTAQPITTTVPNNDSGWGRVDAYAAVLTVAQPSLITGTVTRSGDVAVAGIDVEATPIETFPLVGRPNQVTSNHEGKYRMALVPGLYDLTARGFGYVAQRVERIHVWTDTVQRQDFQLAALPTGTLAVQVWISGSTQVPTLPLRARLLATPLSVTVDSLGRFELSAPEGVYTIELRGNGYRLVTTTVSITPAETTYLTMEVEPAPQLLLVDEGPAY